MFGRATPDAVRLPYRGFVKPGVRFLRETVTAIDPEARRVTTDEGVHEADMLVVALGADYDFAATPGLAEAATSSTPFAGAERVRGVLPAFTRGRAIVGVCGAPFKCPPAPSEAALLLHDDLSRARRPRRLRDLARDAVRDARPAVARHVGGAARGVRRARHRVRPGPRDRALDPAAAAPCSTDGSELPYDLFLGVPKHRAPDVVLESGMAEDGYIPVDSRTLADAVPGRVRGRRRRDRRCAEGGRVRRRSGARRRGDTDRAMRSGGEPPAAYDGRGSCYIEFGVGPRRARRRRLPLGPEADRDVPGAVAELVAEKQHFGASRRARWFS